MNKRKKYVAYILMIMMVLLSTACGPRVYKNRFNIGTSYKKWIKEIGVFSNKNINVWGYEEDKNLIRLYIMCDNGLDGYKELCDIINAHNKFVEENPDYFPEDMRFNILNVAGSQQIISSFYNLPSGDPELGREGSTKIQCTAIDLNVAYYVTYYKDIEDDNIALDIPVISLEGVGPEAPTADTYEFLSEFKNAEQVILEYRDQDDNLLDFDEAQTCEYIKRILPNVEIYSEVFDAQEEEYHLKRIDD